MLGWSRRRAQAHDEPRSTKPRGSVRRHGSRSNRPRTSRPAHKSGHTLPTYRLTPRSRR
uniref:Uncharacterized protein n=1 Tax=Siphoviridae sp. ct45W1 TaxID=2823562 RepID=A0A8S5L6X7_9CAUD|nr:MAG TPA: hypothetical protein [Siphoviridae sp. ct45W1]